MQKAAVLSADNKKRRPSGFEGKTVLGVTGGVGAGKSLILGLLQSSYGALVLQADRVCNELIEPDGGSFHDVVALLGEEVLDPDGRIDKGKMSRMIFSSEEKRLAVNKILHPATFREVCRRIRETENELIVYESAIPREARFRRICDRVLYIYASEETRISRLAQTRGYSEEKSRAIMHAQMSEKAFRRFADEAVFNDGTPEEAAVSLENILKAWGIERKT